MTNFDKDKLKNIPIKEVANKLGLQVRNKSCRCFLHKEETPSLSFDTKSNNWKCFGCGEGGDVIKLVEKYYRYSFVEACNWLSNVFGIVNYASKPSTSTPKPIKNKSKAYYVADPEIYNWFFNNLSVTDNVRRFVKDRQYPDAIVEQYNLKGLDDCEPFFKKCKTIWGIDRLLKCGIAKNHKGEAGESGHKFLWWTDTMFIPFYDNSGNIIFFQGRTLNPVYEKKYKYLNLNKIETVLFNLPILKTIQNGDTLVITEGVTDCISCCLMNKKAIGVLGAHMFKNEYVELLKNFDITIIPDTDKAGDDFADKIRKEFAAIGKTISVRYLKEGYKDITEYYMKEWSRGKTD